MDLLLLLIAASGVGFASFMVGRQVGYEEGFHMGKHVGRTQLMSRRDGEYGS